MTRETVLLLHGFASSRNSRKAQYLRKKFKSLPEFEFLAFDFNPTPKDFEYMTVTGMINRLRQYLLDSGRETVFLVGSSLGALVGLNYAHRFGGVSQMLLLAPALSYVGHSELEHGVFHFAFGRPIPLRDDFAIDGAQYAGTVPPPAPVTIIHGRGDDVIRVARSRCYAAQYPDRVELVEVDSDHRLNDKLDFIWQHLRAMLAV